MINSNLHSVFGVKKTPKELKKKLEEEEFLKEFRLREKNIKKLRIKIDRKIDLISNVETIFDDKYIINKAKINEMLEDLKREYDLIIIDSSQDTKYMKLNKTLISLSSKVVCLVEGNLVYMKNTVRMLNEVAKENSNIKIVYNKKNKYTMRKKMLELVLLKFKLIGVLNYDNKYNKIINKNVNKLYITKKIKKEFESIIKKL